MRPVLLEFGGLKLYGYGLFMVVALMFGTLGAVIAGLRFEARFEKVLATISAAFGGLALLAWIGSAVARGVVGGFLLVPGMFGAVIAAIGAAVLMGRPFARALDAASVGALVGFGVGRIGCFLAGCCAGTPSALPWAVRFPETTAVIPAEIRAQALHPTQLYLTSIFLLAALVLGSFGPRLAPGRTAGLALATIATPSLATGTIRADPPTALGIAAWILLLLIASTGAVLASFTPLRQPRS